MSRRRMMLSPNNIIYQLRNVQFDGNTIIDTGIPLMALNHDWRLRVKTTYPSDTSERTLLDCNNEATTAAYGTSGMGFVARVPNGSPWSFQIKIGNGSSTTELASNLTNGDYIASSTYGKNLHHPISNGETEIEFEVIKQGTDITINVGTTYYKVQWTGATLKNLHIGANIVESTGVKRRYYNGYVYYIILEKI